MLNTTIATEAEDGVRVRIIAVAYSHGNGAALIQRIADDQDWYGEYAIVALTHKFERLEGSNDRCFPYAGMQEADRQYVLAAQSFNKYAEFYPVHA